MSIEWFRWYHGTVADPKLALIARKAKQPRSLVISVWAALLEHASQAKERGNLGGLDVETLAMTLDVEDESVMAVIAALEAKGMIVDQRLASWDKRQVNRERYDDSRERVARHRAKRKDVTPGNATVTPANAEVTPPDTDKDIDTEAAVVISSNNSARARKETEKPAAAADLRSLIEALPVPWPEILGAYHRILPTCIPCHVPTEKLMAQVARLCDPEVDQLPAIENWEMYFGHVATSPLLTGRAPPGNGYDRPFCADLEWLTDWDNFHKVAYENRYHGKRRATHEVRHGLPH